jgi:quercetin dioxygenase-like cupin family protein
MDNQIVHVYDRAPLTVGMDTVPQVSDAEKPTPGPSRGTTRFLGSDEGPWVYYSERPAGAVIPPHSHRSGRTEFLIEGEIAFAFGQPPQDGSQRELTYGAGTMTYVKPGVVYGYKVLRDAKILLSFDAAPGINYA